MFRYCKALGTTAVAFGLLTATAQAQSPFMQPNPGMAQPPGGGFGGAVGIAAPGAPGAGSAINTAALNNMGAGSLVNNNPYAAANALQNQAFNPYMYNPPYYYGYQNSYNGYLTGAASVISSQSQFMISKQQQNLMIEQVRQAKLDTRRKALDEWLYEREKMPTPEQERERARLMERDRSRNDPPVTEIMSAKALNDLLIDLQKLRAKSALATQPTAPIAINPDELKRINVTAARGSGNIGLLKNDGQLTWPLALSAPDFREEKDRLSRLAQEAVRKASFNAAVDPGELKQMQQDLDRISRQLARHVGDLPPSQYIEAKRFLSQFDDAVRALQQPDAGSFLSKKIQARNVSELVDHMTRQGLLFAPAVPGDEAAYLAVHRALAAYDQALLAQGGQ